MTQRFNKYFSVLSIFLDAFLIGFALFLTENLYHHLSFLFFAYQHPAKAPIPRAVYPLFIFEWTGILFLFSVYNNRINLHDAHVFTNILLASLVAMIAMAGTLYLSNLDVSRLFFFTYVGSAYTFVLGWHFVLLKFIKINPVIRERRVLVIGFGKTGKLFHNNLENIPLFNPHIVSYMDHSQLTYKLDGDYIDTSDNIQHIVTKLSVNDIVIALPIKNYMYLNQLINRLHNIPVDVWVIPDQLRQAPCKSTSQVFESNPILDLRIPALNVNQRSVKRAFDLIVTFLSLPIFLPLMSLIAIAIKVENLGPVIFRQERVGENGKLFRMYKFRTMIPNSNALDENPNRVILSDNIIQKNETNPRVTRLGRLLRRTSLDEIPQLFNVLRGEMSLVGPRPEIPCLVNNYELWQHQRFTIPQGITGWWQINGRSNKPMHLNTKDDLYYIQNYSLILDIYILFKTIFVVLKGDGAF